MMDNTVEDEIVYYVTKKLRLDDTRDSCEGGRPNFVSVRDSTELGCRE